MPNPHEAWGQTLQLRQRTQADDLGLRFSCHWMPSEDGGSYQDTQCLTHPEWYHTLFVYLFSKPDRHCKGTAVNHHRRSPGLSRGLLGGGPTPNPQDHVQEMHLPNRVKETWDVAWWTYIWRGMLANHLGSSNHFVF